MSEQTVFYGYCLDPVDGKWSKPVTIAGIDQAYTYCCMHHRLVKEIRVTDREGNIVLLVNDHVLKYPTADGTIREMPLP